MKQPVFFVIALLLQVLLLIVPGMYGWTNVAGLFIFAGVYSFHLWLESCKESKNSEIEDRLKFLETETKNLNVRIQWKGK